MSTHEPEQLPGLFVDPPVPSRTMQWAIIGVIMTVIGFSDYQSGIGVSLAIFYLLPVSLATAWQGGRAGVMVVVVSAIVRIISDVLIVYPEALPLYTWWNVLASVAISLFVVRLLYSLLALQRQLETKVVQRTRELEESIAQRERLQQDILQVGDRERSAIGRELHDELGQHLVATAMAVQALAQRLENLDTAAEARRIVRWIEEAIAKARKLARGLLLASIEPERFAQELEELAVGASQGGVRCRVVQQGGTFGATGVECAQFFRIAQEAVTNALRHARAAAIDITLIHEPGALCLTVEDDGCGFPAEGGRHGPGLGLRIMQHRAKIIHASFSATSMPGAGTKIICRLPRPVTAP